METLGSQLTPETAAKGAQRREHGGDPGSGNTPSAISKFCLRAFHQKFTIVHSPNTLPAAIADIWPDLRRHGGCSSAARLVSSAFT